MTMTNIRLRLCLLAAAFGLAVSVSTAWAEGSLLKVPTRPKVKTTLFWETAADARATVFLFPGGGGGFGKFEDGKTTDSNFLEYFCLDQAPGTLAALPTITV